MRKSLIGVAGMLAVALAVSVRAQETPRPPTEAAVREAVQAEDSAADATPVAPPIAPGTRVRVTVINQCERLYGRLVGADGEALALVLDGESRPVKVPRVSVSRVERGVKGYLGRGVLTGMLPGLVLGAGMGEPEGLLAGALITLPGSLGGALAAKGEHPVLSGALRGALVGGLWGGVIGVAGCGERDSDVTRAECHVGVVVGGATWGLLSGSLAALVGKERWERAEIAQVQLGVVSVRHGLGVRLTCRF
jgi:hypothetical protein